MTLATAHPVLGWIFITAIFAAVMISFVGLYFSANKIHSQLDKFKYRAYNADSLEELKEIEAELWEFYVEKCWHKNLGSRAREILAFIRGRKTAFQDKSPVAK